MKDNEINDFQKVLKIKSVFRRLTQISWNLNQLEKRYNLEGLPDKDVSALFKAYQGYIKEVKEISNELNEFEGEQHG